MVKISADDKASDVIKGVGEKAGTVASAIGTGLKVAGAAAVAGTALIAKSSLDMYSSYEQNLGGVQKIFGNMGKSLEDYAALTGQTVDAAASKWNRLEAAQSAMMANASKAWQTAGLSASAYMEQSTSFGAALVSSLGGDTQKAAEYANRAIIDMADNANTFGTSIGDIQNAYQGFAKQNYTMLDNLKLGYGGTQSEMRRLISDASKMTDVQKKLGVTVDSSSMSFDNIVNAIHVMQESMNVGGTTAREAATTIEGSVNAMRAAWDNWLTGLASDDADMGELTTQLMGALGAVAENAIPRIATIGASIVENLPTALSGLAETLAPVLAEALATAWNMAGKALEGVGFELPEVDASQVMDAFGEVADAAQRFSDQVAPLGAALVDCLGAIAPVLEPLGGVAEAVLGLIGSLLQGVGESFGEYVAPALERLSDAFGSLLEAAQPVIELLQPVAEFLGEAFGEAVSVAIDALTLALDVLMPIINAIGQFAEFLQSVPEAAQQFADGFQAALQALPGAAQELLGLVVQAVVQWASGMVTKALAAGSGFVSGVGSFLSGLPGSVAGWLGGVISTVVGWVSQFGANATSAASQFGSKLRSGLQAIPGTLGNIGSNIIQGIVNGITGAAGRVKDAIADAIGNAMDFAKHILGIASPSKVFKRYGYYVMRGLELGISQNAGLPLNATEEAMRAVADVEPASPSAPYMRASNALGQVLDWLQSDLGDVIADRTPYTGMRDLERIARRGVAYA